MHVQLPKAKTIHRKFPQIDHKSLSCSLLWAFTDSKLVKFSNKIGEYNNKAPLAQGGEHHREGNTNWQFEIDRVKKKKKKKKHNRSKIAAILYLLTQNFIYRRLRQYTEWNRHFVAFMQKRRCLMIIAITYVQWHIWHLPPASNRVQYSSCRIRHLSNPPPSSFPLPSSPTPHQI